MNIFLCRHGETEWNLNKRYQGQLDSKLTEKGEKQAYLLGEFLESKKIDVIYSSPLGRALTTSSIVSNLINKPIIIMDELKEISFGSFHGLNREDVKKTHKHFFTKRVGEEVTTKYPMGESFHDIILRSNSINFNKMMYQNITIIGHNFINKSIRKNILDIPITTAYQLNQKNSEVIYINTIKNSEERYLLSC